MTISMHNYGVVDWLYRLHNHAAKSINKPGLAVSEIEDVVFRECKCSQVSIKDGNVVFGQQIKFDKLGDVFLGIVFKHGVIECSEYEEAYPGLLKKVIDDMLCSHARLDAQNSRWEPIMQ